ncbi:MAG: peptidoglycan binding domain-containing protein, partial [Thermoleophilia bacterium]|nr:peptidoglycan binding domain-containing protein [Thermoleophilia bacterium]
MADSPRIRPPIRGERTLRRRRRIALAAVLGVVGLIAVGVAFAATGDDDVAPGGVRLDGVDVSGLSPEEVRTAARERADALMDVPLVITRTDDPSFRLEVTRESLGARPRVRRAVDEALEPQGIGGRLASIVGLGPSREVRLAFTLDPRKVSALMRRVRTDADTPARPAGLEVGADDVTVVPGAPGFGIDPVALRARILALPENIAVTPAELPPPVTD